jgi:AraC-like DNA-binding protein
MGVDVGPLLRAARIDESVLNDGDGLLTPAQVDALIAESAERAGRDDLGFELGRVIKLSSHDILGYGLLASPTLDYALDLGARYYRLISPLFSMVYTRGERHAEIALRPALAMKPQTLYFHLEAGAVSLFEQIQALIGRPPPHDAWICGFEPAHRRRYAKLAPARWHFDASAPPGARFVLPIEMVDRPNGMADRGALRMAVARCDVLLKRVTRRGIADWVMMMLRESDGSLPRLRDLSHVLHVTPRTLDRRLRRDGETFLELSKRVRSERACALLREGRLPVTQVAYQLGYRDSANFTRAFRRENGMTPSDYRRRYARS